MRVLLILAVACGSHPPPVDPMPIAEPTPIVTTAAAAKLQLGNVVEIQGIARDAKISAAIVNGDLIVYCLELASWPSHLVESDVVGHGTLAQTSEFAAKREGDAGTDGPVYVLRSCTVDQR